MKRLTLFGVLLTLGLFVSTPVFSYQVDQVEIDGIYYDLTSDSTACVVRGSVDSNGDLIIPSSINDNGKVYAVTEIGKEAFAYCGGLTSVTIPNSVTTIDDWAFRDCHNLTSVTIGNTVAEIRRGAFLSCYSLTSVTIPNSVIRIGDYAFEYCSGLNSVTIPNSVIKIRDGAFPSCI